MYNLIYITDEYNEGDMFDRFGRNSMYARDIFVYNLLSLDDVDETLDGKNKITLLSPKKYSEGYFVETGWVSSSKNIDLPSSNTSWTS